MISADSHASDPQALVSALETELDSLVRLLEILDIEHQALLGADPARLEQAVAAKQNAIATHLKARSERELLGLRDNLKEQLETHPFISADSKRLACSTIDKLSACASDSKIKNTRNGKLIAGLKERTNTSLRVLRPEAASIALYGDGGSAENTMGSRLLGSA